MRPKLVLVTEFSKISFIAHATTSLLRPQTDHDALLAMHTASQAICHPTTRGLASGDTFVVVRPTQPGQMTLYFGRRMGLQTSPWSQIKLGCPEEASPRQKQPHRSSETLAEVSPSLRREANMA
ncbi:hypothetical protein AAF712_011932 [Marasmius tenuissimus]|uniref:Uncharacterized protein n=1 Tax=Marasmius tenuissimus TaxID=585030 RepID=A0ABR2ZJX6_9AGAR|nr:hypothetical protein PM082_015239 [Marasmius tenuissimus]